MSKPSPAWEHFPHGADIGIRGIGETVEEAFAMAALALNAIIVDTKETHPTETIEIQCRAPDIELLFFDWINALIYEIDTRQMVFSEFDVQLGNNRLTATIKGEPIDRHKQQTIVEPKGATMSALSVAKTNDHWRAQCIVDV